VNSRTARTTLRNPASKPNKQTNKKQKQKQKSTTTKTKRKKKKKTQLALSMSLKNCGGIFCWDTALNL
jgi:hypothetical protein